MPTRSHYISSIILSFSTFVETKIVDEDVKQEAVLVLLKVLEYKKDFSQWDVRLLDETLEKTNISSEYTPAAVSLVREFVFKYPPYQTTVFIHQYLLALRNDGCSHSTIKNYRSDIDQYAYFIKETHLDNFLSKPKVLSFLKYEQNKGLRYASIYRKLVSLTQFALWAEAQGLIHGVVKELQRLKLNLEKELSKDIGHGIKDTNTEKKPVLSIQTPPSMPYGLSVKPPSDYAAKGARANQEYRSQLHERLNSLSAKFSLSTPQRLTQYFNLALLLLLVLGVGYFGYAQLIKDTPQPFAYPATPNRPARSLSFQGRLTDTAQNPITTATDMRFKLFDDPTAGTELWDSGTCSITPDQDGIFSTGLGDGGVPSDCGPEISEDVFSENASVYLEVTIEAETLDPRQPIKSVAYALNSETLQGYPIDATGSATKSTVVTMNEYGEVIFGEISPKLKSVSGTFTIEAQALTLQTAAGSNGNINLSPDGTGRVNINSDLALDGYLYAPGATLSATYAGGTALVTRGGPSGTAYIQEWQNNAGTALLAITSSGRLEFNSQQGVFQNASAYYMRTVSAGSINIADNNAATILLGNGGGNVGIGTTGVSSYKLNVNGNTNLLSGFDYHINGIGLNDNGSSSSGASLIGLFDDTMTYIAANTTVQGAIKELDTAIGTVSGTNLWTQSLGAIYPLNSTQDLLIGGTATTSAKFAFLNVNSGTPTASISAGTAGASTLTATGILGTTAMQNLTLGNATTGNLSFAPAGSTAMTILQGGNVGIGTTNPREKLDIGSGNIRFSKGLTGGDVGQTFGSLKAFNTNGGGNYETGSIDFIKDSALDNNFGAIAFKTGTYGATTAEVMRITSFGNVGIGTTTPTAKLDIAGNASSSGTLAFRGTTDPKIDILNGENLGIRTSVGGDAGIAERLTILNNGNVGIGSTTPAYKLEIATTNESGRGVNVASTITSGATDVFGVYSVGTAGSSSATGNGFGVFGQLSYSGSGSVSNAAGGRFQGLITGSAPGTANVSGVDVMATSNLTASSIKGVNVSAWGKSGAGTLSNAYGMSIASVTNGGTISNTYGVHIGDITTGTQTNTPFSFYASDANAFNYFAGNVGINSTSPGYKLDVNGTLRANSTVNLTGLGTGTDNTVLILDSSNNVTTDEIDPKVWGTGIVDTGGGTTNYLTKWTNGGETIGDSVIYDNGTNVGVGTTTVGTYRLNVDGSVNLTSGNDFSINGIGLNDNASISSGASLIGLYDDSMTYIAANTTVQGAIKELDTAIGGVSSGASKWDITNGAIYPKNSTTDLLIGGTATTSAKFAFINVNSGTPTASISAGTAGASTLTATGILGTTAMQNLTLGNATTGNLVFAPAGSTAMTILQNGNVGIGSTAPGYKLDITGDLRVTSTANFNGGVELGDASGDLISFNGRVDTDIIPNTDGGLSLGSSAFRWEELFVKGATIDIGDNGDSGLFGYNVAGDYFTFDPDNDTTAEVIINDAGNVGVGTTTASELLTLAGGNVLHYASGNPTLEGSLDTSGTAADVYVSGNYAYVADNVSGMHIMNVTDPANPVLEGTYNPTGFVKGVHVAGKYAYLAAYEDGLVVVDISNPNSPSLVGSYDSNFAEKVYVSGKYAYVADAGGFLYVVNVSNPASPSMVGSYNIGGSGTDVYVSGKYAFVTDDTNGLRILDVTNPASPSLTGSYTVSELFGVYVSGMYAYVADDSDGLRILDISNPASPSLVGTYNTAGSASKVVVAGNYAYVGDTSGGVQVVNVANRASPSLVGTYDTSGSATKLFLSGKYLYVSDGSAGLAVIDINGSTTPSISTGNLQASSLFITENGDFGNNLYVRNGLNVGAGGILTDGALSVSGVGYFGGNVGIGSVSPGMKLDVNGDIRAASGSDFYVGSIGLNDNASVSSGASLVGLYDDSMTYITANTTVQGAIKELDTAIGTVSTGASRWDITLGALHPKNTTTDLLIGGTATTSAKFAFLNVNSGTPTASISAGTNGAATLTATGVLGTTAMQNLTLGNSTTGNLTFAPAGSTAMTILQNGNVGIGSTAPGAKLDFGALTSSNQMGIRTVNNLDATGATTADAYSIYNSFNPVGLAGVDLANVYGIYNSGTAGKSEYIYGVYNNLIASGSPGPGASNIYGTYNNFTTNHSSTTGYGSYFETNSSTSAGTQYAYYANMTAGTATKYGLYLNGGINYLSGNLGIGDTTPDQLLEVLSSGAANTQLSLGNTNAGDYDAQIGFELADGTNTFTVGVDDSDGDKFKISTTGLGTNDRFIIDSTGNIGINDSTPTYKLDVNGDGRFTGAVDLDGDLELNSTLTDVNGSVGTSGQILSSTATGVDWVDASTVGTNYWQRVAGNLSPLTLNDTISATTSAATAMTITQTGAFNALLIEDQASDASPFIIDQAGNVGIGSTSVNYKFLVTDSSTLTQSRFENSNASGRTILEAGITGGAGGAQFDFRTHGSSYSETLFDNSMADASALISQNSSVFVIGNFANSDLVLGTNNAERLRILADGNIGIGDATPTYKLDVNGTGRFTGAVDLDGDLELNSTLTDVNGSVGSSGQILSSTATGVDWVDASTVGTNYWQRVAGNLSPLTLNDTISATTSAATAMTITQTGAFNALLIEDQASDASPFIIDQAGNVGVGTTATAGKLDVNGIFRSTYVGSSTAIEVFGTDRLIGSSGGGHVGLAGATISVGTNLNYPSTNSIFTTTGGDTSSGSYAFYARNSALTDLMVIQNNGNVGIGTTSPLNLAHLRTSGAASLQYGLTLQNPNGTDGSAATGISFISDTGTAAKGGLAYLKDLSGWSRGSFHILQNSTGDGSSAGIADSVFTVLNNGNVGIGSTAPAQKLQVAGNGAFTGNVAIGTSSVSQRLTVNGTDPVVKIANDTLNSGTNSIQFNHAPGVSINKSGIFSEATGSWGLGQLHIAVNDDGDNSTNVSLTDTVATFTGAGNVGIGDTTPTYKLDVNGTGRFTGAVDLDGDLELNSTLTDVNGSVGTSGQILSSTATGVDWVDASTVGTNYWQRVAGNLSPATLNDTLSATTSAGVAMTITQTGAFDAFLVQDEASDTSPFVINQSGNVGIGTFNPGQKLDVAGNIQALGNIQNVYGGLGRSENLIRDSESLDGSNWTTVNGGSVSGNATVSPDGTTTADTVSLSVGGGAPMVRQTVAITSGVTYTFSAWVKAQSIGNFYFEGNDGTNTYTSSQLSAQLSTTEWRRISHTFTAGASGTGYVGIKGDASQNRVYDIWGAQLETTTAPGVYVKTDNTSSFAQTNALVAINKVVTNSIGLSGSDTLSLVNKSGTTQSLFDLTNNGYYFGYNTTTNAASKFQVNSDVEIGGNLNSAFGGIGRVQNLVLDSEDITSGNWALSGSAGSRTANSTASPDGRTTADTFTITVGGSPTTLRQDITGMASSTAYTLSFWAKGDSSTLNVTINDGTTSTTTNAGANITSTWRRYKVNATTGTVSGTPYIQFQGSAAENRTVYLWGIQLEAASTAGPYAKTSSSQMSTYYGGILEGLNITTGNLGIGTTAPTQKLDIDGNVRFRDQLYDENNSVGTPGQILSTTATGVDWIDAPSGGAVAWNDLTAPTGNLSLAMDADTTSFSYNTLTSGTGWSLNSTATAFTGTLSDITLSGSNAANTGTLLALNNTGTSNANTSMLINHYATGTNNLAMRVNDVSGDTSPFVIEGTGNVGVGTSAPIAKLHVYPDNTSNFQHIFADSGNLFKISRASDDWTVFSVDHSNARIDTNYDFYSSSSTRFYAGNSWGSAEYSYTMDGPAYHSPTTGTAGGLNLEEIFSPTSGTATFTGLNVATTIDQTGGANGITRGLYINPTLTAAADWRSLDIANNSGFAIYQSGASATNYFNGNVGIGDSTPTYDLDVNGTGRFTGAVDLDADLELNSTLTDVNGSVGTSGQILSSTATGVDWIDAPSGTNYWQRIAGNLSPLTLNDTISATTSAATAFTITQTGAFNAVLVEDQASDTSPFIINQDGNVGIGSTAASYKLDVTGDLRTTSTANFNAGVELGDATGDLISFNGRVDTSIVPNADGTVSLGSSTLRWDELFVKGATIDIGDDGDSGLFGYNVASDYFSFDPDNDATAEFVMTDTGNLGIGSVTPGQALDVVGNIRGAMFIDSLGAGSYFLDPAAGTTSLVVAGNIGIGSLGPTVALDVVGTGVFTGNVGIADAGPDYKLEISSATSADSSFALSDGDVAHGMTDITGAQGTDVYGLFRAISSTAGGLKLEAFSDTDATAFNMYGYVGNTTVTNTTPAIKLFGAIKTSATSADMAADDTVFQIANNDNTADFTMLGNGNVGIGSVTPGQKLSVSGNILATGNLVAGAYVRGENVAIGGNADGTFSGCSDFADMVCGSSNLWLGTNGGSIFFEDAVDANDKNITNIDNLQIDNNVGIGTTDVSSGRLNIQGAVTTGMLIEDSTTQGIRINSLASNAVGARISTTGSSGIGVQVDSVGTAGEFTSSGGDAIVGSGSWRGNSVITSETSTTASTSCTVGNTTISTRGLMYYITNTVGTNVVDINRRYNITGLTNTEGSMAFINSRAVKLIPTSGSNRSTVTICINGTQVSSVTTALNASAATVIESYIIVYINGAWRINSGLQTSDAADLAEWLEYQGQTPQSGQLMSLIDNTKGTLSNVAYQDGLAGVVSTVPHTTMGPESENSIPLALAGRVPVIVTTKNGQLKPGDYITSSNYAGTGMKARFAGQVVGKAMESTASWVSCPAVSDINNIPWPEDDGTNPNKPCFTLPNGDVVGKIMMLIDNSWYEGDIKIDEAGQIQIAEQNGTYTVTEVGSGHAIERIVAYSQAIVGQIRAGMINTKDLVVEETASIANLSVESLQINGQSLADYIASVVGNGLQAPSNGQLAGDQSPVTTIELDDDEMFDIQDTDGTTVASIDSDGNASFSGEISSRVALLNELNADNASISGTTSLGSLLAENASVSGTLTAENIDAGSARIDMLESRVAELQAIKAQTAELVDATVSGTLYADNIANFEARVANAIDQPSLLAALLQQMPQNPVPPSTIIPPIEGAGYTATGAAELNLSLEDLNLDTDDVVLQPTAVFIDQYLKVNGIAYVADSLGVGNRLLVGDGMQMSNGVIAYEPSTTESPLFTIQPSGKGSLELMAGLMTLNENGSVAVNGNLTVAGSLAVNETLLSNLLQPTDFNNPFQVQVAGVSTTSGELKQSRFEIINENKVPVATISAQGRAQFAGGIGIGSEDLGNGPVLQSSQTSGRATLSAYNPEVTIISDKITENSLVYITPVGSTNNRVLYVKSQEVDNPLTPEVDGKFVVGFDEALYTDIQFNWWIIN